MKRRNTKGFHYQLTGVRRIENFGGRAVLADEMGLGKTYQALLWMHFNSIRRTVVVCPAHLKINWQREAWKHFGIRSEVCSGRKPPRRHRFREHLVIINYEILKGWLDKLIAYDGRLLILDEAHRAQNRSSLTYKCIHELQIDVPHLLTLSGTPLTNKPAELWTLLNLVAPHAYPSFLKFAWKHCQPRRTPWGWEFKGATRIQELHRRAKKVCLIRRLVSQVRKDLPPRSTNMVLLDLEDRAQYDNARLGFVDWLKMAKQKHIKGTVQALARRNELKKLVGELKLPAVMEWVDEYLSDSDRKLVVFGYHRHVLEQLHKRYRNSVLVYGGLTPNKRQRCIDEFQHKKTTRILFGNYQACGEGLNLTAASDLACVEFPDTPKELDQACARIDRIGQTEACRFWMLVAKDTMEGRQLKMLQRKSEVVKQVLDGKNAEPMELYDQLLLEMED